MRITLIIAVFLFLSAGNPVAASQAKSEEQLLESAKSLRSDDIPSLLKKAGAGDRNSQLILARAYDQGYGVEPNAAKAVEWYRKAAEQGN